MGMVGKDLMDVFNRARNSIPELFTILGDGASTNVVIVGFRNDFTDEMEAICDGWQRLQGVIDGLCFLTEELQPKPCSTVLIREGDSADAHLKQYLDVGWVRWEPGTGQDSARPWIERNRMLMDYVLQFLKGVALAENAGQSPLGLQLGYSVKMYRAGIASGNAGIQYPNS